MEDAPGRPKPAIRGTTETAVRDFGSVSRPFAAPYRSQRAAARLRYQPNPRKLRDEIQDIGRYNYYCNINILDVAERQGFEPWVPLKAQRFSRLTDAVLGSVTVLSLG